jgi:hypothetical protein
MPVRQFVHKKSAKLDRSRHIMTPIYTFVPIIYCNFSNENYVGLSQTINS